MLEAVLWMSVPNFVHCRSLGDLYENQNLNYTKLIIEMDSFIMAEADGEVSSMYVRVYSTHMHPYVQSVILKSNN
jgi:hypothetical protein